MSDFASSAHAGAVLTLDGVSIHSPSGQALFPPLHLAIGRERVGLVGRNGCGKSSLLRALAGPGVPA
ncbi:ATP-binding cassette domain-containing protein, partial [Novosphingobium sp. 1949]